MNTATIPYPVTLSGRLANERRWLAWREEESASGRLTKVPYYKVSVKGDTSKASTWLTRAEAEKVAHQIRAQSPGRQVGIGVVMGARNAAAATPLSGFDLDKAFDALGGLEPWAQDLVSAFPGYWETSPSKNGLHGLFRYKRADVARLKAATKEHGTKWTRGSGDHPPCIDLFLGRGYLTVTEDRLPQSAETIDEVATDDLLCLIENTGPVFAGKKTRTGKPKDETRNGRAWWIGIAIIARNGDKDAFQEAIEADSELAKWAEERDGDESNIDRTWRRLSEKFGWMREFKRQKNGSPLSNLFNAQLSLSNTDEIVLAYNEMRRAEMLMKPVPDFDFPWNRPRPVTDVDVTTIQAWLQRHGLVTVSNDVTHKAVDSVAQKRRYHPVRDYLNKLKWDRVERHDTFLQTYFGAKDTRYNRAVGKMFLIQMVARAFEPGCQADYTLVLEGEQGDQKSTGCRILAGGEEYFSSSMPPIRGDERIIAQHVSDKWLIEIGELSALSKARREQVKQFMTRREEKYLRRYAHREATEPRQFVCIATCNELELNDPTGSRRWWPVKTGNIDLVALQNDRDMLMAEAVARYRRGEPWWPERDFEKQIIKPEQDVRYAEDAWESTIEAYLNHPINGPARTSVSEIALEILQIDLRHVNDAHGVRVRAILRHLGWEPDHGGKGNFWRDKR